MTEHIDAVVRGLGEELTERRVSRGLTREEAVALLLKTVGVDIGDRTLLSYEHGVRALTVRRFLELAAAYGVPAPLVLAEAIRRAGEDPRCRTCGRE